MRRDYPSPSFWNVWYGIAIPRLLASVWPLQGHGNQRLRAHTLTSQDARDRVGLDNATLSLNPSETPH